MTRRAVARLGHALGFVLSLAPVSRATIVTVDDADPRMQYAGAWMHSTVDDSQQLAYLGTLAYTNTSGATATLHFEGSAVVVVGAFGPAGTFAMRSQYTLDGGVPTLFVPPSEVDVPIPRRLFFASGELPFGAHVLAIENLGEQFWLDFIQVVSPDEIPPTTVEETAARTSGIGGMPSFAKPSDGQTSGVHLSASSSRFPSSSTRSSSSNTQTSSARTSTSALGTILTFPTLPHSSHPSSSPSTTPNEGAPNTPQPSSASILPSAQATQGHIGATSGIRVNTGSPIMAPSAIAGVAIAGLILLLVVLAATVWWKRRTQLEARIREARSGSGASGSTTLESVERNTPSYAHSNDRWGQTETRTAPHAAPRGGVASPLSPVPSWNARPPRRARGAGMNYPNFPREGGLDAGPSTSKALMSPSSMPLLEQHWHIPPPLDALRGESPRDGRTRRTVTFHHTVTTDGRRSVHGSTRLPLDERLGEGSSTQVGSLSSTTSTRTLPPSHRPGHS
ncbi:hypothetical protein C8Q78DRAFT_15782 [Trametes maxima]|nr:hypothetical protein C8Q78DRAFT_15782 [Trametes maxima]